MRTFGKGFTRYLACLLLIFTVVFLLSGSAFSAEEKFPSKPVTVIVPFGPGGAADQMVQGIRPFFREKFGVPLVCDYRPGGSGQVGWEILANAPDDCYTIAVLSTPHFQITQISQDPSYDMNTFYPVVTYNKDVPIIYTSKNSPYNSIKDVVEDAKARPKKVVAGTGSLISDLGVFLLGLEQAAGIEFAKVITNAGSATLSGTLGRHFDIGVQRPLSALSAKEELKGLAVLSKERAKSWPEVPTAKEALPEMDIPQVASWLGFLIKNDARGKYPERYEILAQGFKEILSDPAFLETAARRMHEIELIDPAEFHQEMVVEFDVMKELFKDIEL